MEECYFNNVYCCFLPAHTSQGLQPADNGHFNILKGAFRKEIERMDSLTDATPTGKINFIRCLAKARKAVTKATIVSAWTHTGNWPISRAKALRHPEIKPDKEERGISQPLPEAEDGENEEPITRQYVLSLAQGGNALERHKARRIASEIEDLRARISFLEEENAAHKEREDLTLKTKKRKAIPNPNRKFMSIHEILSQGGSLEDLEAQDQPQKRPRKGANIEVPVDEDDDEEEPESGID
jgi:hypothetical protein